MAHEIDPSMSVAAASVVTRVIASEGSLADASTPYKWIKPKI